MKKFSLLITFFTIATSTCFASPNSCESLFSPSLKDFRLGNIHYKVPFKAELYEFRFADHKAFLKIFELIEGSESKVIGFKDDGDGNTIALLLLTPKAAAKLMRQLEIEEFAFEFGVIPESDYKNLDLRNLESNTDIQRYQEIEREEAPVFRGKNIPKNNSITKTYQFELTFEGKFKDKLLTAFKQRGLKILSLTEGTNLVLTVDMPAEELFKFVSQQEGFMEAHPLKPMRRK